MQIIAKNMNNHIRRKIIYRNEINNYEKLLIIYYAIEFKN